MTKRIMPQMKTFTAIFLLYFVLHVIADLRISNTKIVKAPGENVLVMCNDTGGRKITWFSSKGVYNSTTQPHVQVTERLGTSLYFYPLSENDGGNYTCKAGEDSRTFTLILRKPLKIVDTPTTVYAKEYERVVLRCDADGDDSLEITWSPFNPNKNKILADGLLIYNATKEDTGNYTCQASVSSTGDVATIKIALIVQYKPSPIDRENWMQREEVYGFINGYVDLICDVDGYPPLTFEWYKNRDRLNRDHAMSNLSTLTVDIKDRSSFGEYTCKAKNKLGSITKHFILKEGVQPPPPEGVSAVAENSGVVVLAIRGPNGTDLDDQNNNEDGMSPVGYRIEYRPLRIRDVKTNETEEEIPWDFVDQPIVEDNRYPLYNLTEDTEYEIRVATLNKAGLSFYTDTTIIRTMKRNGKAAATLLCSQLLILTFVISIGY